MIRAIEQVTPDIVLSANDADAPKWLENVAVVTDKYADVGGISGIHSALITGRDVLVAAWDMPFANGQLLSLIVETGLRERADAVVPESRSPHGIEPFHAWYSARTLPVLERFIADGGGSARDFIDRLGKVHRIPISESRRFGDPDILFFSVNTADDLARARAIAEAAE